MLAVGEIPMLRPWPSWSLFDLRMRTSFARAGAFWVTRSSALARAIPLIRVRTSAVIGDGWPASWWTTEIVASRRRNVDTLKMVARSVRYSAHVVGVVGSDGRPCRSAQPLKCLPVRLVPRPGGSRPAAQVVELADLLQLRQRGGGRGVVVRHHLESEDMRGPSDK
jgi:hypothetical protein